MGEGEIDTPRDRDGSFDLQRHDHRLIFLLSGFF